jgi:hypothetical protein
VAFDEFTRTLQEFMARGNATEAQAVLEQMRALQEQSRGSISAAVLPPYEQKIARLLRRLEDFRVQIAALVQQAIAAAQKGDEPAAAVLLRRLTAIHVTYPHLLDEAGVEQIRTDIVRATAQHDDRLTARRLVDRERAVAAEIVKIAAAVHEFHRVVCRAPASTEEFRSAEAAYLRTLQEVRAHDPEWLAGFVLELADLLAEWRLPGRAVRKQIDRFLESVRRGMQRVHAEMTRIDEARGSGRTMGETRRPGTK